MNELIKIQVRENQQLVSARELHEFLGVKARFNDWFPRMCEYEFQENRDFIALTQKRVTAQGNQITFSDYLITLSMAKEISMLQRNEKGKQARKYFIECERKLEVNKTDITQIVTEMKEIIKRAEKVIQDFSPVGSTKEEYMTVVEYTTKEGIKAGEYKAMSIGKQAAQICKARGLAIKKVPSERFGEINTYPERVLAEIFNKRKEVVMLACKIVDNAKQRKETEGGGEKPWKLI